MFRRRRTFKGITMDRLASSIGMSKRTIYELFDSKQDLICECVEYNFRQLGEQCAMQAEKAENAFDYFFHVWEIVNNNLEDLIPIVDEFKTLYPEVHSRMAKAHSEFAMAHLERFFEQSKNSGLIQREVSWEVFFYAWRFSIRFMENVDPKERSDIKDVKYRHVVILIIIMRGVSTVKGVEYIDQRIEYLKNKYRK